MTRAKRFTTYASISGVLYFLVFFNIFSVPFVEEETADLIIPVVSPLLRYFWPFLGTQ